jgi:hypothetical protein
LFAFTETIAMSAKLAGIAKEKPRLVLRDRRGLREFRDVGRGGADWRAVIQRGRS